MPIQPDQDKTYSPKYFVQEPWYAGVAGNAGMQNYSHTPYAPTPSRPIYLHYGLSIRFVPSYSIALSFFFRCFLSNFLWRERISAIQYVSIITSLAIDDRTAGLLLPGSAWARHWQFQTIISVAPRNLNPQLWIHH